MLGLYVKCKVGNEICGFEKLDIFTPILIVFCMIKFPPIKYILDSLFIILIHFSSIHNDCVLSSINDNLFISTYFSLAFFIHLKL